MRDYLVIGIILLSLPVGLFNPFYGLLVYAWVSYMYPQDLAWSFAKILPIAKFSALSVMGGLLFSRKWDISALRQRENISMLLLWCTFTVSSIFAFYPAAAWDRWQYASKLILMSILASMLLRNRGQIRLFLLVIAFSLGFYGFKGGIFGIATHGTEMVLGPENSAFEANNNVGLALNMCLPLLWYLAREEKGWLKRALQCTAVLTIPAIMFTYSRGSALTLGVVLLVMMLRSRHPLLLTCVVLIAGVIAAPFIPQKWFARQQSVMTYEEDRSAMSRIDNWRFCWKLALDRPLTGAGFELQSREVFEKYSPEFILKYNGKVWDTHNTFLGILTSHGFPGLTAFVAMIGFSLWSCFSLKRQVRNRPDLKWVATYSEMIQISFLGFMLNGMVVNMEYFDLPYHWIAVVATMKTIVSRELTEDRSEVQEIDDAPDGFATV